jgi:hypothetical protein
VIDAAVTIPEATQSNDTPLPVVDTVVPTEIPLAPVEQSQIPVVDQVLIPTEIIPATVEQAPTPIVEV